MKKRHTHDSTDALILEEAKKRLKAKKISPVSKPSDDTRKLIHELHVHEVELEMQNEELRMGQIELEESRRKYSDLFDFAPIGYMLLDLNGLIKEINLTGSTMLGVERSRLINKPFQLFVSPEDTNTFMSHMRKCRETHEKTETELRLKVKQSAPITANVMSAPSHASDEYGFLLKTVFTDNSAIKNAHEVLKETNLLMKEEVRRYEQSEARVRCLNIELEKYASKLEDLNKNLEEFNFSLAHDLSAPLRIIDGFANMLVKYYSSKIDDEGKEFINTIRNNTRKMSQLIKDILSLSRLGSKEIKKAEIDMTALASSVIDDVKDTEPGREIQFNIKPMPPALGEKTMMRQVLFNLLANAVKFTRPRKKAIIEVGGHAEKGENTYYVKDNGAGFDNAHVNMLFNIFRRLHSEEAFEGTGSGLAIVKRIIERHGGRVRAEGKVDKGATFYFILPAATEDAEDLP